MHFFENFSGVMANKVSSKFFTARVSERTTSSKFGPCHFKKMRNSRFQEIKMNYPFSSLKKAPCGKNRRENLIFSK